MTLAGSFWISILITIISPTFAYSYTQVPLSLNWLNQDNFIGEATVGLLVNGHSEVCLLDTGADRSTLPLRPEYSSTPVGSITSMTIEGESTLGLYRVGAISLGEIRYENGICALDPAGGCKLGMAFFSSGELYLDFVSAHIRAGSSVLSRRPRASSMRSFFQSRRSIILPVILGAGAGRVFNATFDTGANITVIDRSVLAAYPAAFQEAPNVNINVGSGVSASAYRLTRLRVGNISISNSLVVVMDLSSFSLSDGRPLQMIIGFNHISRGKWYFDFPHQQWFNWRN